MGEWTVYKLDDVTINFDARRVPIRSSDRKAGAYPYYGASGIVGHVDGYLYDGEHLLIAEDGENLRTRKTPIAFIASGRFWVNNHAHVVTGNHLANTHYLCYALEMTDVSGYLSGSTQPKLTQAALNRIELRLPERQYQAAVVQILGALDDKIAINEYIARTAFSLAEARYVELAAKTTRSTSVGDLLDMKYGKALPAAARTAGNVAVYGSGGISGSHNQALAIGPGIIIGRKGTVGTVYWSENDFYPIDTTFWVTLRHEPLPIEYAFFLLRDLGLDSMNSDSAVPGLNRSSVLALQVRVPSDEVLQSFRVTTRPIFQLREAISVESAILAKLRDTLLPKLLSGQLRVRDAEKIVEEVT